MEVTNLCYYQLEVRRGKYLGLEVFLLQYSLSCEEMKTIAITFDEYEYSWVIKIRNTSAAVLRPQYTPWSY